MSGPLRTLCPSRLVALATVLAMAVIACSEPSEQRARPLGDGPVGVEDAVQHLLQPPAYPGGIETASAVLAELRAPGLRDRHHVFLADAPGDVSFDEPPVAGSVVRLTDGASVTSDLVLSVARLDGDTVTGGASDCGPPCELTGPALVAAEGWLGGIGVSEGWELVVPAPTE
jgi:hypothetical protein